MRYDLFFPEFIKSSMVIKLNTKNRANFYFADHVLNNKCWCLIDVQGQFKEAFWKSHLTSNACMGYISLEGQHRISSIKTLIDE